MFYEICSWWFIVSWLIFFHDYSQSRKIYPYKKYNQFNLEFNHLLSFCNQDILRTRKLALYCDEIHQKETPPQNRFFGGRVLRIFRLKINQSNVYNGHKRVHGIKLQSLGLPNGLIGNLSGPCVRKRHDSTMLHESGLAKHLQRSAWNNNQLLCIYNVPAYSWFIHLQVLFSRQNLTSDLVNYNKAMSQTQVSIERPFNEIKTYFKFVCRWNHKWI